ncbi:MAG TPA: extracellular solute-binding protein [Firmicutes bacterium]|nr:extracellular solute-binding protein [Bacillota bacterium]
MVKKVRYGFLVLLVMVFVFSTLNISAAKVKLELFQNKQEAIKTFDELIARFEKTHPGVDIEQNFVPNAETVIKARLVKNDIPDIMAIGGNATYGELAAAGVLYDFSKERAVNMVHSSYIEMLNRLAGKKVPNGIPYSANANTVLYNKDKFAELGLTVPRTWDEFIATAEKIKQAGQVPLYLTFKDAWTCMVPWNTLASNLHGDDFFDKMETGQTSFAERYPEVAEKMLALLNYGHNENFGVGYDQGNTAFANGASVMYLQGIWAIGSIKAANPDINIGVFSLPATNDPAKNRLVSGVDTVLTIPARGRHNKIALEFIYFLLEKENAEYYINQENLFSAVKEVYQTSPDLVGIREYFETGRITSFADHYYPPGMQVANLIQEFLLKKDVPAFLRVMDNEAAIVDGCSVWKLFWKVVFPLMAPINATVGVLTVLWVWNDFLLPLVMLSRPDQMTLPLVQFVFQSQFDTNYNLAFASYLMVLSPVIVVYIIAQKWIISGVMRGAIKG